MQFYGNTHSQQRIQRFLRKKNPPKTIALVGPPHLGKRSFILNELQSFLAISDFLVVDCSIAGAREAKIFCSTAPLFSPIKVILVDDAGNLSEPAQDAYLKLCEETPSNVCIIIITEDIGYLLPALQSRIRETIRWLPLNSNEMKAFIQSIPLEDCPALGLCNGRPGWCQFMCEHEELSELYNLITEIVDGSINPAVVLTPEVVSDLPNKPSLMREAVAMTCSIAVRSVIRNLALYNGSFNNLCRRSLNFLQFSSILIKSPSVNAEIYWQKTCFLSV
jgi:hypothetical protein